MRKRFMGIIFLLLLAGAWAGSPIPGQKSPRDIIGKLTGKIDVDSLFGSKPTLSTTLADAVTGVPFLDGFEPLGFESLSLQPRGAGGAFLVEKGGLYAFEAESYCLLPGTHGPGRGHGYLLAPLKGPRAEIIRNILFRAADHPAVPQKDIQVLIWAILARSRIDLDSANLLKTAMALLTPKEIFAVNGGALGLISDNVLSKALDRISPALRPICQAESALRDALSRANATYEELERIAVLDDEGEEVDGGPDIPSGRWSYHPKGYFIRYFTEKFSSTVVEVYCPENFTIERDPLGRVTAIAHADGERIEMAYAEEKAGTGASGAGAVSACAVQAIRLAFVYPQGVGRIVEAECTDPGWTLTGDPGDREHSAAGSNGFPGFADCVEAAWKHKMEMKELLAGLKKSGRAQPSRGDATAGAVFSAEQWGRIMSLHHAVLVLKRAATAGKLAHPKWMTDPVDLAYRAWQTEVARCLKGPAAGEAAAASREDSGRGPCLPLFIARGNGEDEGGGIDGGIDLSPDGGQPGDPGTQREGISNRGTPENEKCDGAYKGCKILAGQDFMTCTAECMGMGEGPLTSQQRLCQVECSRRFSQDQKDCQTMVRNCKGL